MLNISLTRGSGALQQVRMTAIFWGLVYVVISALELKNYVSLRSPVFLLGLFCLIQVSVGESGKKKSFRFAWISLALSMLTIFLPVKTILYLCCSMSLLFLLETNHGKVNLSALIILFLMSPVFEYASAIFSFPIRLELTSLAATVMSLSGQQVISHGNTLTVNANEFSVDPECMGLYMLETSLLLGLLISNFYRSKSKCQLSAGKIFIILGLIAVLNVMANLLRIVTLVQFNILPGTVMHEVVGLCCLFVYVIIPGVFLAKQIVRFKTTPDVHSVSNYLNPNKLQLLCVLVGFSLAFAVFNISRKAVTQSLTSGKTPAINGYKAKRVDAEIVKFTAPGILIYAKSINGFFTVEHNPLICWRGSGYKLSNISTTQSMGHEIYKARLAKGDEELFTAWWFYNKKSVTISQASWRWDVLTGGPDYTLINVTSNNPETLNTELEEILSTRRLDAAIGP